MIETEPTRPNEIGMHRVAFSVDDIDEAREISARHGYHPLRGVATWAATPEDGRFTGAEVTATARALRTALDELAARGERLPRSSTNKRGLPHITLGFRAGRAVVHRFDSADSVSLHVGGGSVPSDAVVDVPILDESASFSGAFVLDLDAAREVVELSLDVPTATRHVAHAVGARTTHPLGGRHDRKCRDSARCMDVL